MRALGPSWSEAIDIVCQHDYLGYDGEFFARTRRCENMPRARTPNDYIELAGSLFVAWRVAEHWPKGQEHRKWVLQIRSAIRSLLEVDDYIDSSVRQYLEQREREYDPGGLMDLGWLEERGFPKRRDHLTYADLGRESRGAAKRLFVREVSLAMCAIFGKPHDKVVGELAGLAFETKALPKDTVRTMRKKSGLTQPKNARVKPLSGKSGLTRPKRDAS
jgi:hypothetical protein